MNRNELTTAENLKIGDRFYKLGDKKKEVLQMVLNNTKVTHYRTYRFFCCPVSAIDNTLMSQKLKDYQIKPILKETKVIFLKNVND